jgi:hypothetical protein
VATETGNEIEIETETEIGKEIETEIIEKKTGIVETETETEIETETVTVIDIEIVEVDEVMMNGVIQIHVIPSVNDRNHRNELTRAIEMRTIRK